jgi:hypothetical protein
MRRIRDVLAILIYSRSNSSLFACYLPVTKGALTSGFKAASYLEITTPWKSSFFLDFYL